MSNPTRCNHASRLRRAFVERFAHHHGTLNRADFMQLFGISKAQAAADIRGVMEEHSGCMSYDTAAKSYVWTEGREPVLPIPPPVRAFDFD